MVSHARFGQKVSVIYDRPDLMACKLIVFWLVPRETLLVVRDLGDRRTIGIILRRFRALELIWEV